MRKGGGANVPRPCPPTWFLQPSGAERPRCLTDKSVLYVNLQYVEWQYTCCSTLYVCWCNTYVHVHCAVRIYFPLCIVTLRKNLPYFLTSLLPHEKNALVIHTTFVASKLTFHMIIMIASEKGQGQGTKNT